MAQTQLVAANGEVWGCEVDSIYGNETNICGFSCKIACKPSTSRYLTESEQKKMTNIARATVANASKPSPGRKKKGKR